jgi:site-specific recombinase XerD
VGADDRAIATVLGHSDLRNTPLYALTEEQALVEVWGGFPHPSALLNRIRII